MFGLVLGAVFCVCHSSALSNTWQNRIKQRPAPVVPFKLEWYLGKWFTQSRQEPCSWKGSSDFENMELNFVLDPKKNLLYDHSIWKKDNRCVFVTFDIIPSSKTPGAFMIQDPLGDVQSGECVILAIDPNKFVVEWGCTKVASIGQRCDDPWVSVHTRERFPSPKVFAKIDLALMTTVGVRLAELPRLSHSNMPCVLGQGKFAASDFL
ncbi:hypothetical protein DPMN_100737 [Dreissena polymorpha]|uniref:Uncharacterized protein n=2 Tax=Dreissena polymorpha TaxID=45954 RepID=A0A9D4R8G9_DREPO|nr:hypothetical protein DPMN_100737 [Dreissena polymorpha]